MGERGSRSATADGVSSIQPQTVQSHRIHGVSFRPGLDSEGTQWWQDVKKVFRAGSDECLTEEAHPACQASISAAGGNGRICEVLGRQHEPHGPVSDEDEDEQQRAIFKSASCSNASSFTTSNTKTLEATPQTSIELLERMPRGFSAPPILAGSASAKQYNLLSFIFLDVVGFTTLCAEQPVMDMVYLLDDLFSAFDSRLAEFDVLKVDTMGDGYMACCGIDQATSKDQSTRLLGFACALLQEVKDQDKRLRASGSPLVSSASRPPLRIRVGMHCGPAVAAALGVVKPKMTFFGDTVNVASRMESHGFPGCVHLSEDFLKQLISEGHSPNPFIAFGERQIKGRGSMRTFVACCGDWRSVIAIALTTAEAGRKTAAETDDEAGDGGPGRLRRSSFRRLPAVSVLGQQSYPAIETRTGPAHLPRRTCSERYAGGRQVGGPISPPGEAPEESQQARRTWPPDHCRQQLRHSVDIGTCVRATASALPAVEGADVDELDSPWSPWSRKDAAGRSSDFGSNASANAVEKLCEWAAEDAEPDLSDDGPEDLLHSLLEQDAPTPTARNAGANARRLERITSCGILEALVDSADSGSEAGGSGASWAVGSPAVANVLGPQDEARKIRGSPPRRTCR